MSDQINHSEVFNFSDKVPYSSNGIVSKKVIHKSSANISLFAFDKGQELSEHSAPFDALVQILDGTALVYINKQEYSLKKGDSIILPANIPHAVKADNPFKMLLTMIKE